MPKVCFLGQVVSYGFASVCLYTERYCGVSPVCVIRGLPEADDERYH